MSSLCKVFGGVEINGQEFDWNETNGKVVFKQLLQFANTNFKGWQFINADYDGNFGGDILVIYPPSNQKSCYIGKRALHNLFRDLKLHYKE